MLQEAQRVEIDARRGRSSPSLAPEAGGAFARRCGKTERLAVKTWCTGHALVERGKTGGVAEGSALAGMLGTVRRAIRTVVAPRAGGWNNGGLRAVGSRRAHRAVVSSSFAGVCPGGTRRGLSDGTFAEMAERTID